MDVGKKDEVKINLNLKLLMSLNLTNGCLLIDNSALEKWRCPYEFNASFNLRRSLVASRAGRNFGSACHEGWAIRYILSNNKLVIPSTVDKINDAMREYFEHSPEPEGDFRNYGHAVHYMAEYNRVYQDEPFSILTQPLHCKTPGKPIIEEPFMLPFAIARRTVGQWEVLPWNEEVYQQWRAQPSPYIIPIFYTGKIDLGIENNNGIFSFDHKTTFQFGEQFEKDMMINGGQRGYCWALGKIMGRKATGYIIDACRVRRPSKKSDYGVDASVDPTDFQRIPKWLDQTELDEWETDVRAILQNVLTTESTGLYPRHRWECIRKYGECDFYQVCTALVTQRQWHLFESNLYEENKWSPLHKANEEV